MCYVVVLRDSDTLQNSLALSGLLLRLPVRSLQTDYLALFDIFNSTGGPSNYSIIANENTDQHRENLKMYISNKALISVPRCL